MIMNNTTCASWTDLVIGGIIGTLIGLFAQHILDFIFGHKHLKPLLGNYTATFKNGKPAEKIKAIKITKHRGRTLFIESLHEDGSHVKSEIFFNTPKNGSGWYNHIEKDSFGLREIVIINKKKLAVWNRYTKDHTYINEGENSTKCDPKMFSSIDQSYIWTKKSPH